MPIDWREADARLEPRSGTGLGPHLEQLEPSDDIRLGDLDQELELANELVESVDIDPDFSSEDPYRGLKEMHVRLKQEVIDQFAYKTIFEPRLGFLEEFRDTYNLDSEEVLPALHGDIELPEELREENKNGLLDRLNVFGEEDKEESRSLLYRELKLHHDNPDASIFRDENDLADAIIADYYFRGGKGLRSTLGAITDYAFTGEISKESLLMGAMIEVLHTSTLLQDDEMDGDEKRRGRKSAFGLNRDFYGEYGDFLSILDGNQMEAWTNEMNIMLRDLGVPVNSQYAFPAAQAEVNKGQRTDILLEGVDLDDTSLEEYESMSMNKTGYLFLAMTKMVADNIFQEDERENFYPELNRYIANFNFAFQGQDDFLEAFRESMDKSDSDISNRKNTLPAINTYQELQKVRERGGEDFRPDDLFLYFFNQEYEGKVGSNIEKVPVLGEAILSRTSNYDDWMEHTAEEMGLDLPEDPYQSEEFIREVIEKYGEERSEEQLRGYAEEGREALDRMHDAGYINERGWKLFETLIDYMPDRAI